MLKLYQYLYLCLLVTKKHILFPKEGDNVAEKILSYNRANRAVAILCNHQRAPPKTFDQSMANLQAKVKTYPGLMFLIMYVFKTVFKWSCSRLMAERNNLLLPSLN